MAIFKADSPLIRDFDKDQIPFVRERVSITLLIGASLVPLFGIVDYLLFPEYLLQFMTIRLLVGVLCLGLLGLNLRWNFGEKSCYLGAAGVYITALGIIRMIIVTGGYTTTYYAGLNLIFLAFCAIMTVGMRFVLVHSAIIYMIYIGSVLVFSPRENINLFIANNMFIFTTLVIGLIASSTDYRHRFRQYQLRLKLEEAQSQLKVYSRMLEDSVAESEVKYRMLVDHANEGIFIVQDGVVKFPNPKTCDLLGYSEEEFKSTSFMDLVADEDRENVMERGRLISTERKPALMLPFRMVNKLGKTLWVDMNSVPIEWKGRPATLHLLRDITQRKSMETELMQAQKMEAIGTLAGGIAHEFNNLLQVISGSLQLLFKAKSSDHPDARYLNHIDKAVQRATALTKKLLVYSRKVESQLEVVDLNHQVTQVCELLERLIPKLITIEQDLDPELRPVRADPAQLEQIIMNLAVNARDAMAHGGRFILKTRNVLIDEEYCRSHLGSSPGRYVCLGVSDTGHGMDQDVLERIFDPFYTTKEPGKGTGLGLAIVYSIVTNHNGFVRCTSEKGKGTTFEIYFPAEVGEVAARIDARVSDQEIQGRGETILLVDDEQEVLDVGRELLERFGYRVLTAHDGENALQVFSEFENEVQCIILDLNMPGQDGQTCLERLLALSPRMKIIVATGYLESERRREMIQLGASGFVTKPYRFTDMLRELKRSLAA
ncbi:MAG: response regulator [Syntrophobacteraceae bacterium]|nr:response regulator [Syntrophobacteraceae bacterium]